MIRPFAHSLLLATLALFTAASATQAATTTALSFTGGEEFIYDGFSVGWRFSLTSPVTITALGFYDYDNDGLAAAHDVGIYVTSTKALVVSATIPSGTAGVLDHGFRYNSMPTGTLTLAAGDYVISAQGGAHVISGDTYLGDYFMGNTQASGLTMAAGVTFIENREGVSLILAFPDSTRPDLNKGAFGPNFQFSTAAVPEPGSLGLLALGGLAAATRRRRAV